MKSSKILLLIPLITSLTSCNQGVRYLTVVGFDGYFNYKTDSFFLAADHLNLKANKLLTKVKSSYQSDFKMIDQDPYIITSAKKYLTSDILTASSLVIFSYRSEDVLRSMTDIDSYDFSLREKDLALFDYYLEMTYEEYTRFCNAKTIVLGLFDCLIDPYFYNDIASEFNKTLKEKANRFHFTFIDTKFVTEYYIGGQIKDTGLHLLSNELIKAYNA